MINLTLTELAGILGVDGSAYAGLEFTGVTIDSRKSCEAQLFVALKGVNFDGHQFVGAAFDNGAVAALVEKPVNSDIPQLVVEDCIQAMGQMANYWRRLCDPCVIGLTGSNGKTTVKEMLFQILAGQASTHATRGNLNNDIGVPLTLFELSKDHDYAIIEMGANHRGEIALLADIAEPDIVFINNAAAAHLAGFGDIQGVIEAKGELYAYCSPKQQALFNADEAATGYWRSLCAAQTQLTCALDNDADVGVDWQTVREGILVELSYQGETQVCKLAVMGEHNARNAVAAVALALLAGVEFNQAVNNLSGFTGVKGRLQLMSGPSHSCLINDSYNANPGSLVAGIKVLCALDGAAWLALGDMGELGDEAVEFHRKAVQTARELGVEKFFGVGDMSCQASSEFGPAGYCFERVEEMADSILAQIHPEVNLLVKGSRAAGMERLVDLLTQASRGGDANAV